MEDRNLRFLVVAGEASGDLHGSHLVRSLKAACPHARFFGLGGKKMRQEGVRTFFDIERMGTFGFIEVLGELFHYLKVYRFLTSQITSGNYDAVILINYPTLNLRLAKVARKAGCAVFFFIGPHVWAWRRGRIKKIRKTVDKMYVVLPFEEAMYQKEGVDAEFLGHPFIDLVRPSLEKERAFREFNLNPGVKTIGLLPGSRKNEIQALLNVMLEAAGEIRKTFQDCQFILPIADSIDPEIIRGQLKSNPLGIRLVEGKSYDVMNCCDLLVIASGSATLEAGILGVPMVIIYRLNALTYWIANNFIRVKMIGLVNIVAGERVVPELLQEQVTANNIAREAIAFLENPKRLQETRSRLSQIRETLGQPGVTKKIAESIYGFLDRRAAHEKISV